MSCALLALALGWRYLALKYMAKLRARRPAPATIWLVEARPRYDDIGHVVGAFATRALAEAGLQMHLATGQASCLPDEYEINETQLFYAGEWLPK